MKQTLDRIARWRGPLIVIAVLLTGGVALAAANLPAVLQMVLPHRVHASGWADLRDDAILEAGPEARERGRELLESAARAHGLEAWRGHATLEVVALDLWADPGPWWPQQNQRFRHRQWVDSFTSRVELLDGAAEGERWGLQSWTPYKLPPASSRPRFLGDDDADLDAVTFYLPTLQYFNEMPFRVLSAPIVIHAGRATLHGRAYERVFVTWESTEPSGEYDQYVVWIGVESGLVEKVHYTVREAVRYTAPGRKTLIKAAGVGTIHFDDFRDVDGVVFPFLQVVTLFGPRQAELPLADNYFHKLVVERAGFDTFPAEELIVDHGLPRPADRKPGGTVQGR